ncbi:YlxM family DNA-binding protein [Spiroplasma alleghenense]|uniref:UPF0122 protein SALLE_v1c06640 n=1 Tax=Spiroplasma alleghenense TaxID=216931 RepID=A0A345Z405_9MOLU|nr:sigma factor-like helix-turn-helix DNA-binding protein [Spiroplasma alleghenense]AXK51334.1 hypothetical protein SALLE_v1c06640 [Spiroplasma alleghenense]
MTSNFEKNDHVIELFDIYKNFLTTKQKQYFEFYFFEDFSLQEIAEEHQISRAAVSDSIKNAIKLLEECEEKVKLLKITQSIRNILEEYKDDADNKIKELINKIEKEI